MIQKLELCYHFHHKTNFKESTLKYFMKPGKNRSPFYGQEIECKWRIRSLNDFGSLFKAVKAQDVRISNPETLKIKDIYLDTLNRFFSRSKTKCRIRSQNGRFELTFKNFSTLKNGIVIRQEKNLPIPKARSEKEALNYCRQNYFNKMLGTKNMMTFFILKNDRIIRKISADRFTAELSFDHVDMSRGKRSVKMMEAELEFLEGNIKDFTRFTSLISNKSGLVQAKSSKFTQAITCLFERPPLETSVEIPPKYYSFTKHDTIGYAASKIIKTNFDKLLLNEAGVRIQLDIESLHDMRVACRRLRAASKLFRQELPISDRFEKRLSKLGKVLGQKRDWDVYISMLTDMIENLSDKDQKVLRNYIYSFSNKMNRCQNNILQFLNSRVYKSIINSLRQLSEIKNQKSSKLVLEMAPRYIEQRLDKTLKSDKKLRRSSSDKELHAFRIAMKKLRYTCEFFEPVMGEKISEIIGEIKKAQDLLGAHQDAISQSNLTRSMLHSQKGQTRKTLQFVISELEQRKLKSRKAFFKMMKKLKIKKWRDYIR